MIIVVTILLAAALMLGLALLFTITLGVAKVRLHVDVDPRIERIEQILPGANCGGCGAAGCANFARAVVEGKLPTGGCPVGGAEVSALIADIMGVEFSAGHPLRPVVRCQARREDRLGRESIIPSAPATRPTLSAACRPVPTDVWASATASTPADTMPSQ